MERKPIFHFHQFSASRERLTPSGALALIFIVDPKIYKFSNTLLHETKYRINHFNTSTLQFLVYSKIVSADFF